jgi:hypothetical protein
VYIHTCCTEAEYLSVQGNNGRQAAEAAHFIRLFSKPHPSNQKKPHLMKTEHSANPRLAGTLVYGVLAIWFLASLVLSLQGVFQTGPSGMPLPVGLSVVVPIVAFTVLYWVNTSVRAFADSLDLRSMVALNILRLIGVDFLVAYAHGRLPAGFAFPAGLGDILTALLAIPLIVAMSGSQQASTRKWFVAWNLLGLADLVVAVASGIMHSGSRLGILAGDGPTTLLMSQFPRALIPTFLVPIYILLHLLALARRGEVKGGAGSSGQPWRAAHA